MPWWAPSRGPTRSSRASVRKPPRAEQTAQPRRRRRRPVPQAYSRKRRRRARKSSSSGWGEILPDQVMTAAILDRLLHRSVTINFRGESYRLRQHRKAGLTPQPLADGKEVAPSAGSHAHRSLQAVATPTPNRSR
jgi:hypothetical protein